MSKNQPLSEETYLADCRKLPGYTFDKAVAAFSKGNPNRFFLKQTVNRHLPEARSADFTFLLPDEQRIGLAYGPLFCRFVEAPSTGIVFVEADWFEEHPDNFTFIEDSLEASSWTYIDLERFQESVQNLAASKEVEGACKVISSTVGNILKSSPTQLSEAIMRMLKTGLPIETAITAIMKDRLNSPSFPQLADALIAARITDATIVRALEAAMGINSASENSSAVVRQLHQGFRKAGVRDTNRTLKALADAGWDEDRVAKSTAWLTARP